MKSIACGRFPVIITGEVLGEAAEDGGAILLQIEMTAGEPSLLAGSGGQCAPSVQIVRGDAGVRDAVVQEQREVEWVLGGVFIRRQEGEIRAEDRDVVRQQVGVARDNGGNPAVPRADLREELVVG